MQFFSSFVVFQYFTIEINIYIYIFFTTSVEYELQRWYLIYQYRSIQSPKMSLLIFSYGLCISHSSKLTLIFTSILQRTILFLFRDIFLQCDRWHHWFLFIVITRTRRIGYRHGTDGVSVCGLRTYTTVTKTRFQKQFLPATCGEQRISQASPAVAASPSNTLS